MCVFFFNDTATTEIYTLSLHDALPIFAKAAGFESGYKLLLFYYGSSDWTDVPSPMLRDPSKLSKLPANIQPSLESFITVADTTEGRHYVANPYFHMVDTAGNQLPYINEQDETYINENEVRILKAINGEFDYKRSEERRVGKECRSRWSPAQ